MAEPERLYAIAYEGFDPDGKPHTFDGCSYPLFRRMRAAVKDQAELIAVSYADRTDLTYGSDEEMEKAYPSIRFRVDVRLVRTAARGGAAASPKTTISSRARIPTLCSLTIIGPAASGGIRK